jgi:hypothetical protein
MNSACSEVSSMFSFARLSPATKAPVSSGGLVLGVAVGSATITATSEGKSGSRVVTISSVPVASVSVAPPTPSVNVAATVQLTATTRDAGNNVLVGRPVSWSSNDTTKARVSSSGLVTGVAAGSATITATSEGINGTATVTVTPVSSGTVDTLFADGFETGALTDFNRWHDIIGNFTIVTAAGEGITAPAGTKIMKIDVPGGAITHFVSTAATSPHEHIKFSYRMYRKAGYGSGGLRSGMIRGSVTQWGSFGVGGNCPDDPNNVHQQEFFALNLTQPSADNWQLRMYNYWLGMQHGGPTLCYGTYGLGPGDVPQVTYHDITYAPAESQWYLYEVELQLNTPGQSNGWEKVWVNGVLKIEHLNVTYRNNAATKIWGVTFDVGNTTVGTAYIDDVLVTVPHP